MNKFEDRNIRKIQTAKGSYLISLPIELMREFGWREGHKVVVTRVRRGEITIRDWKK